VFQDLFQLFTHPKKRSMLNFDSGHEIHSLDPRLAGRLSSPEISMRSNSDIPSTPLG